eukprot:983919-Pyramimonas_sp.AAC.1
MEIATELCDRSVPEEDAMYWAMWHLNECYNTLTTKDKTALFTNSVKFALQNTALAKLLPQCFRIKPKMHAWLEACAEGGDPTSH